MQAARSASTVRTPRFAKSSATLIPTMEAPTTTALFTCLSSNARRNRKASSFVRIKKRRSGSSPGIAGAKADAPVAIRILS